MTSGRLTKLLEMERAKPGDSFLIFAIAQEYVNGGNDEQAKQYFEALYGQSPQYVPLYYHLGKLYERIGEDEKAKEIYAKGVEQAKAANDLKTAGELNEALTILEE